MKELLESIKPVVAGEIARANNKNPPKYNSMHEGHGFIREEVEEAAEELEHILSQIRYIWSSIREDNFQRSLERMELLKKRAYNLAAESIQIIVTAEKFMNSFSSNGDSNKN